MRYIDLSQIDLNDSDVQNWLLKAQQHLNALMLLQTHKDRAEYFKTHNIWSDLMLNIMCFEVFRTILMGILQNA